MDENWKVQDLGESERKETRRPRAPLPWSQVLSLVVGIVGVIAICAAAWVYSSTQRELVRLATDVAQLRLSLDLYSKQQPTGAASGGNDLQDLSNRLAILEQSWRGNATASPTALPSTPASAPAASATPTGGDCLPPGTRFMVAAGDSYPVCGSSAVINIGAVDDGFITLADGTVVAQGGNIAMPGTGCMLGVVPSDGGSLSGFAEIRVSC